MSKQITFKDRVKIFVTAGSGGNGCSSFRREPYVPRGGPNGGDGGLGGHVFLRANENVDSLLDLYFQQHQKAENGAHGKGKDMHGRRGKDLYVEVPAGTVVRLEETGELIGELLEHGAEMQVARGGAGGLGNARFMTTSNQAPRESTPGEAGEEKTLLLELKMVADVGLVGYPNAGKSTLLRALTAAKPKTASYPFTTLNPIIGTIQFEDFKTLRIADIPGLIDGAHTGVGLGHDFLRHIERTAFLVFVIDMAGTDGRMPDEDYRNLRRELGAYHPELNELPFLVVANKMDQPDAEAYLPDFISLTSTEPLAVSALDGSGVEVVKEELHGHFYPAAT